MRKDRDVALMLSLYLGTIGADRLYLGQVLLGVLKAVTLGAFGIWTIVDSGFQCWRPYAMRSPE